MDHALGRGLIDDCGSRGKLLISVLRISGDSGIVRIPLFTIRLRRFFFSLTLTRFFADWMFGNSVHLPLGSLKNHRKR